MRSLGERAQADDVGVRTFSKAYGLAGVRVGYAFGSQEIIEASGTESLRLYSM